jgi:phosphate transport system permease protein
LAALLIRVSGVSVILAVIAIVLSIAVQAVPLFRPASVGPVVRIAAADAVAVGLTSFAGTSWWLDPDGNLAATAEDRLVRGPAIVPGSTVRAADTVLDGAVSVLAADGRVAVGRVSVPRRRAGDSDAAEIRWSELVATTSAELGLDAEGVTGAVNDAGEVAVAVWGADGVSVAVSRAGLGLGPAVRLEVSEVVGVALSDTLEHVAVVASDGELALYRAADAVSVAIAGDVSSVALARFLKGGRSLAVAGRDGSVSVLVETPRAEVTNRGSEPLSVGSVEVAPGRSAVLPDTASVADLVGRRAVEVRRIDPLWRPVHRFEPAIGAPTVVAAAARGRTFAVADDTGRTTLYSGTSGRRLESTRWGSQPVTALALARRGDALLASTGGVVLRRSLFNPHPEISLRTLFFPVWYEGYAEPRAIWQTSGGGDDFQPKFGLQPLLLGTVKATVYAMLISVPLALMAALYVSQLAPGWLQAVVKPAVEMMAAVPTVVVGFLAALWLAPRLEVWLFPVLVASAALLPAVGVALIAWRALPAGWRHRAPEGAELAFLVVCLLAVGGIAFGVAGVLEDRLFDGGFQQMLFDVFGIQVEQRNGLIVGLALGFAVIPVIFTIAEDACSGVPPSLVLAARALGATRWQAAVRLVVPAAAPGLAAAVMLGLGRAVGETMIVLMAAGNTPILDLGPFNGMRTMSAAIAFEMPEAAVGGTLFRVLFFTGFLLFVLCLVFTTSADLISRRLRRRYARL